MLSNNSSAGLKVAGERGEWPVSGSASKYDGDRRGECAACCDRRRTCRAALSVLRGSSVPRRFHVARTRHEPPLLSTKQALGPGQLIGRLLRVRVELEVGPAEQPEGPGCDEQRENLETPEWLALRRGEGSGCPKSSKAAWFVRRSPSPPEPVAAEAAELSRPGGGHRRGRSGKRHVVSTCR